ncbi:hypothetical protein IRJ41_017793, partial [Triplophysa rosa]
ERTEYFAKEQRTDVRVLSRLCVRQGPAEETCCCFMQTDWIFVNLSRPFGAKREVVENHKFRARRDNLLQLDSVDSH